MRCRLAAAERRLSHGATREGRSGGWDGGEEPEPMRDGRERRTGGEGLGAVRRPGNLVCQRRAGRIFYYSVGTHALLCKIGEIG
jgi:hypothetical protein